MGRGAWPDVSSLWPESVGKRDRETGVLSRNGRLTTDTRHLTPALYNSNLRSLSALLITDTELNVMAAAAIMGLSSNPNTG